MTAATAVPGVAPGVPPSAPGDSRPALTVDWPRILLAALVAVPYGLGWLAGATVRAVLLTVAALAQGYEDGRAAAKGRAGGRAAAGAPPAPHPGPAVMPPGSRMWP